jgi:hypothetical protein
VHGAAARPDGVGPGDTPLVDAALSGRRTTSPISIQRVVGPDGITRTIVRQIR